jgi:hypothetical protein
LVPRDRRASWVVAGTVTSTLAVAALLGPWAAFGSRRFTSLDLISSASALELIDGRRKQLVLAAWLVIPALTAAGYVLAALGRWRLWAWTLLLMAPTYVTALLTIRSRSPLQTLWALHLGVAVAIATTVTGIALLLSRGAPGEP